MISSGKSAQFPRTGAASATFHSPGESLLETDDGAGAGKYLSTFKHAELVVSIDELLISTAFIASIDEAMEHFDVRSQYSTECGRQLAYALDKFVIRCIGAGARAAALYTGAPTGDTIELAADGAGLIAGIKDAAQKMDENDVPQEGRMCVLPPSMYYLLVDSNKDAINRDYNNPGNGSVAEGVVVSAFGMRILKSNHVPSTNETSDALMAHAGIRNDPFAGAGVGYGANFANTKGFCFHQSSVAVVKLMDLAVESEYQVERQGTILAAKLACGASHLRQEACFELQDAS